MEFFHAIDSGTWDKPEVFSIAESLQISQGDAFMACLLMWDYFRRNSIDGTVSGVTPKSIDRLVRLPGFADAAINVKWLEAIDGGLRQPAFEAHLHGCVSLKAYKHVQRAKKSNDKQALLNALRVLDPEAADRAEVGAQEIVREKRTLKKTESKRESETLTERNGESSPCRAVPDSKVSDSQESQRPESINLVELAKRLPLLQQLDSIRVEPSGAVVIGSVISPDRIKREEIERADTQFWLSWYRDQLSAKTPMLRAGNAAEVCFVLASVLAAKRCKNVENKLALWITWLKARECGSISQSDWRTAAERIRKALGLQSDVAPDAAPTAEPKTVPASDRPRLSHHEKRRLLREAEEAEKKKKLDEEQSSDGQS